MRDVTPKVDGRYLLFIGVAIVASSQLVASRLTAEAGYWDLVAPNMIRSFGLAFIFIPVTVMALSDLSDAQRGNATGLFNLTRELGGSIGTAMMGMVVTDGAKRNASYLSEHVTPYSAIASEQMRAMSATKSGVAETLMSMRISQQAMVLSFEHGFQLVAVAIALGAGLVFLLKRPKPGVEISGAH